ncbi:MAG: class I SAM-dependent methyltransferase [Candidatus Omnitrophica bacterium]|nr:class I SAM-dependent methyltransferase [Candidatus Omnitrophota bacterium]
MHIERESINEDWHKNELEWWEKYSTLMAHQWRLNKPFNMVVRSQLENDFTGYLFKKGGKLLDLGCGSGWLAAKFAEKGMSVVGIDFSCKQIELAEQLKSKKNLRNARFECADLLKWGYGGHEGEFDSIFVNAFLHHLPPNELRFILKNIIKVLKPQGKVYIYEPLRCANSKRGKLLCLLDYVFCKGVSFLSGRIPDIFDLWDESFKKFVKNGYAASSPREGPIDIRVIEDCCLPVLKIKEIKGWHLYSIGFSMQVMLLKKHARMAYLPLVCFWYLADRLLFRLFDWKDFSDQGRFILCGIKLEK